MTQAKKVNGQRNGGTRGGGIARHPVLSAGAMELVAGRFRVLSDVTRLRILQVLEEGEMSVSKIVEAVESTQPNVSKHLRLMQDTGLVSRRQDGNTVYYAIADPTIFALCDIVCSSLADRYSTHASVLSNVTNRRRETTE